jgi:hypothetical protein
MTITGACYEVAIDGTPRSYAYAYGRCDHP